MARAAEIGAQRLSTPSCKVRKLQKSLQAKAKSGPGHRFYTLWDKVYRLGVLTEAFARCRSNRGAPGVDGESFDDIETHGVEAWLASLQEELQAGAYRPKPLLRVWIPKASGGKRPLGIPVIRDRVVQMAMLLVIGPIFEADMLPQQYGFRSGLDAKMAIRRVYYHVTQGGRREVVDADLSDYFTSIPHGPLMRCLSRRIADGHVLSTIRQWLRVPVVEHTPAGPVRTTAARDSKRGTPQGGVISPLFSNLYFRRFLLAWEKFGHRKRFDACVVNYADDFVICCPPGKGDAAMAEMRGLMTRLGLTVNERKTRLVRLPEEKFDFLGYTIGRYYGRGGREYIGTRPSQKAVSRLLARIREETSPQWHWSPPEIRVTVLNRLIRGWSGYFNQGPVLRAYRRVERYTERRLRRWLMRRRKQRGTGYRQYPDQYLYEVLGLLRLPGSREAMTNAKVCRPR